MVCELTRAVSAIKRLPKWQELSCKLEHDDQRSGTRSRRNLLLVLRTAIKVLMPHRSRANIQCAAKCSETIKGPVSSDWHPSLYSYAGMLAAFDDYWPSTPRLLWSPSNFVVVSGRKTDNLIKTKKHLVISHVFCCCCCCFSFSTCSSVTVISTTNLPSMHTHFPASLPLLV